MTTATVAAVMPGADAARCIPALGRLPAGVTAAVDPWVLREETPAVLDFIARYAEALLAAPLPPLEAVIVLYPSYPDSPGLFYFYCLAPAGMDFEEELPWAALLCDREQEFADTLSDDEVALLDERIVLFYAPFFPAGFESGGLPTWFRHDGR